MRAKSSCEICEVQQTLDWERKSESLIVVKERGENLQRRPRCKKCTDCNV
jgi:hypothetical protein